MYYMAFCLPKFLCHTCVNVDVEMTYCSEHLKNKTHSKLKSVFITSC